MSINLRCRNARGTMTSWWTEKIRVFLRNYQVKKEESIGLRFGSDMLDDESLTSANLWNDHRFMIKEYSLHWYEAFWGSPKQTHESLCSKWTISYHGRESCSSNRIPICTDPQPHVSYLQLSAPSPSLSSSTQKWLIQLGLVV